MAKKKDATFRKKKKDADSYRHITKKVNVSESDLTMLRERARQAGMRVATYCYAVLIGKYINYTDMEHKKARIAATTIIANFTQICNHPNVKDFLSPDNIDTLKKMSKNIGNIIKMDVYTRYGNKYYFNETEECIDESDKLRLCNIKKGDPKNKRLKRLEISISQKDKVRLTSRAADINLNLSQYIYFRIMNRRLKYFPHLHTKILQRIAGQSGIINEISHKYNIENKLSNIDVATLMNAVGQIKISE